MEAKINRNIVDKIYLRKAELTDCDNLQSAYERSLKHLQPWSTLPADIENYISNQEVYLLCCGNDIAGVFTISGIVRGFFQSAYLGYNVFVPYQTKVTCLLGLHYY